MENMCQIYKINILPHLQYIFSNFYILEVLYISEYMPISVIFIYTYMCLINKHSYVFVYMCIDKDRGI